MSEDKKTSWGRHIAVGFGLVIGAILGLALVTNVLF